MGLNKLFSQYDNREVRNAYMFLLPVLLVIILFILFPVIGTIYNSFFKVLDVGGGQSTFVGFGNYGQFLFDAQYAPRFWESVKFTMMFTFTTVIIESFIGLMFALILNESFKGRGILRTVILIPWAIPTVVSAVMWKQIYNSSFGFIKWLMVTFGANPSVITLGDFQSAFWALVVAEIWKTTPFVVIILLAGLQAIPQDLYKQGQIDGAKMFRQFMKITLPLIMPVLTIALIFRTIDCIRVFDIIYVLTSGKWGTETLSYLGFINYTVDLGKGSTVSVLTFILSFLITLLYIKFGKFGKSIKA
ncbi:MAG: hypothetical protein A2014_11650 [Spirochaetes bacterium GWF1_49_6]|nr:MAG: hypothetical protein A2014_11650 [Spirochaetes bacterium GWF1_49_6]